MRKVSILISEEIVTEISQVLSYPKIERIYQFTDKNKGDLMEQVLKIAKFVEVTDKVKVIQEHPADNRFLECALTAKAIYIVSGDKHLLKVDNYKKIKTISVSDFIKLVE